MGEEAIFDAVKDGKVEFERCICHTDSLQKLNKAGIARILGPRGLMPSNKTGTVVSQVGTTVRNMVGGSEYRERLGVIRMAVGQLGFTPDELQTNVKAFMDTLKKDIGQMSDRISKEIHEVVRLVSLVVLVKKRLTYNQVLSSTNAPGFTLNGEFRNANSVPTKDISGPL